MTSFIIATALATAGIAQMDTYVEQLSPLPETEIQSTTNSRLLEGQAIFDLVAVNDSIEGVYCLIRVNNDQTYVTSKLCPISSEGGSVLYSFTDSGLPLEKASYKLVRVTTEVETLQVWHYNPVTHALIPDSAPNFDDLLSKK